MVNYLLRDDERIILLSDFYTYSDPVGNGNLFLFRECKRLDSEYCKRFNDHGYDNEYKRIDIKKMISELASKTDEALFLSYFNSYKENIKCYHNFFGRYYTLICKENILKNSSLWPEKRKEVENILSKYPEGGIKVLSAIYYVNAEMGITFKNYYMVKAQAMNMGFSGKNWFKILSELQLAGIIASGSYKHIEIHKEILPLVGEIVKQSTRK